MLSPVLHLIDKGKKPHKLHCLIVVLPQPPGTDLRAGKQRRQTDRHMGRKSGQGRQRPPKEALKLVQLII